MRDAVRSTGSDIASSHLTNANTHKEITSNLDIKRKNTLHDLLTHSTAVPFESERKVRNLPNETASTIKNRKNNLIDLSTKEPYEENKIPLFNSFFVGSFDGPETTNMTGSEQDTFFEVDVSTVSNSTSFGSIRGQIEQFLVRDAPKKVGPVGESHRPRLLEKEIPDVNCTNFPLSSFDEIHFESWAMKNIQSYYFRSVFYQVSQGHDGLGGKISEAAEDLLARNCTNTNTQSLRKSPRGFPRSFGLVQHSISEPKITIIDSKLKIIVIDLVSEEECDLILHFTEAHVQNAEAAGRKPWSQLYEYTRFDLPCCEILALRGITTWLLNQIRIIVGRIFRAPWAASRLIPRSWKEPHLLRYQNTEQIQTQSGSKMHFDGSDLTWQLMLNDYGQDYEGKLLWNRAPGLAFQTLPDFPMPCH